MTTIEQELHRLREHAGRLAKECAALKEELDDKDRALARQMQARSEVEAERDELRTKLDIATDALHAARRWRDEAEDQRAEALTERDDAMKAAGDTAK
jgi:chromosome segregation ATPase